jgi:putative PIN family toxin of toxin-antitoxin system
VLRVVLDTNILVSALWTPAGNASAIVGFILTGKIEPCFDTCILDEYRSVLRRPRLAFPANQVDAFLAEITNRGLTVNVSPGKIPMPDESDRKFFDVARACEALLITGNVKHYPEHAIVLTPAQFLARHDHSFFL